MKKNTVTYKKITGRKYKVYGFANGSITELDTIEVEKKPTEVSLCKHYGVKKVVLEEMEKTTETYSMPVDEFLQYATLVDDNDNTETEE